MLVMHIKMKFVAAFAVLALASQCLATPSAVKDEYKDLIVTFLTYIKQDLSTLDPLPIPPLYQPKNRKNKTQDWDLVVDQLNGVISKASNFTVEDVTTDPNTLTATVKIYLPELLQTFDFNVAGVAFGKKVSSSGSASISAKGIEPSVSLTFVNPDTSVQISKLKFEYNMDSLTVTHPGLQIDGMSEEEVENLVSLNMADYLIDQKAEMEAGISKLLQLAFNNGMAGETLAHVVARIKSLIHH